MAIDLSKNMLIEKEHECVWSKFSLNTTEMKIKILNLILDHQDINKDNNFELDQDLVLQKSTFGEISTSQS